MALNIPIKNTGDNLTASEFNQVISEINKKADISDIPNISTLATKVELTEGMDKKANISDIPDMSILVTKSELSGKADKTSVYTKQEVDNKIKASSCLVSMQEQEIGVFQYGGKDYTLYEQTVEISGLPVTAGNETDIILSSDPLGGNLYLKVDCLSIAVGIGDKSDFPISAYEIKRVHVDASMNTVATIACKESVTGVVKAILTLRYVKGLLSFDTLELSIPLTELNITSADEITVEIPPLKYNKKFAYTYTFDDDVVQSYGKAFCTINKKWVDAEKFFHVGQVRTTGAIPSKTLGYTDGCGVEKRFTFGVAIWPNLGNSVIDNYMNPTGKKIDKYYPYLVWNDLVPLLDFGSDLYLHNVNERIYDKTNAAEVTAGLQEDQVTVFSKLNRKIKILARPDGNNVYVTAGRNNEDTYFTIVENSIDDGSAPLNVNFNVDVNLYKKAQFRRYTEPIADAVQLLVKIQEARDSGQYTWMHDFSHAPTAFQYILDLFTTINNTFGKDGDDSVWFASVDEVFEYAFIRRNSFISKRVENGNLIIRVRAAKMPLFTKNELSLLLKKSSALATINTVSIGDIVKGLNKNIQADGSLLVNLNFGEHLVNMADKYTAKFEESTNYEDKDDALYFVNQLRADLQVPYLTRLNTGNVPPILNSISINSGASMTYDRNVTIVFDVTGGIAGYKITEGDDFTGMNWIDCTSKTIQYNLSEVFECKTIRVLVKNEHGESGVKTGSITLVERPVITHSVTATTNNNVYGTVLPASQSVADGDAATVTATATEGYVIEGWMGCDSFTGVGETSGTSIVNNVMTDKVITCNFKVREPIASSKTIISFNKELSVSGINVINMDTKEVNLIDNHNINHVTYLNQAAFGLPDNRPKHATAFDAIETPGAPYIFDAYKIVQAAYGSTLGESNKSELHFRVTSGTYRVKIYGNTNNGTIGNSQYRVYSISGVQQTPTFEMKGNVDNYVVFDNVTPVDGKIVLGMWYMKAWVAIPVNVLEIEKIS